MTEKKLKKEIKNIVDQLIERYRPEKIILFGSAVWGRVGPDSDLDFLIIKKNVPYYGIERMRQVRRLVETNLPCDFLVAKPSEIKERLALGDPFVKQIVAEGRVIYG